MREHKRHNKWASVGLVSILSLAGLGLMTGPAVAEDSDSQEAIDIDDSAAQNDQKAVDKGQSIEDDSVGKATVWGKEGTVGVVMAHGAVYDADSWSKQGRDITDNGHIALAVEDTSADKLVAAAQYLRQNYQVNQVVLLGASAGGTAAIEAASSYPKAFNQLILLSPAGGDISDVDDMAKLFIFSKDESMAGDVTKMASQASGDVKVVPVDGDAHAQAIFDGDQADKAMSAILKSVSAADEDEGEAVEDDEGRLEDEED